MRGNAVLGTIAYRSCHDDYHNNKDDDDDFDDDEDDDGTDDTSSYPGCRGGWFWLPSFSAWLLRSDMMPSNNKQVTITIIISIITFVIIFIFIVIVIFVNIIFVTYAIFLTSSTPIGQIVMITSFITHKCFRPPNVEIHRSTVSLALPSVSQEKFWIHYRLGGLQQRVSCCKTETTWSRRQMFKFCKSSFSARNLQVWNFLNSHKINLSNVACLPISAFKQEFLHFWQQKGLKIKE